MPSIHASSSRRHLLATIGTVVGAGISGCNTLESSDGPEGEGETIEIILTNATADPSTIAVRVEDDDGNPLFSRVYELDPHHSDESAGIETRPSTVRAFTPGGTAAEWDYDPDIDMQCEGKDIQIMLTSDNLFELSYSC